MTVYVTDWLSVRDLKSHRAELTADTSSELDAFMQKVMDEVKEEAAKHGEEVHPPVYRWDPVTWCYLVDNTTASYAALAGARLLRDLDMGRYMARRAGLERGFPDTEMRRDDYRY